MADGRCLPPRGASYLSYLRSLVVTKIAPHLTHLTHITSLKSIPLLSPLANVMYRDETGHMVGTGVHKQKDAKVYMSYVICLLMLFSYSIIVF
jgi:hypothetical protein